MNLQIFCKEKDLMSENCNICFCMYYYQTEYIVQQYINMITTILGEVQ